MEQNTSINPDAKSTAAERLTRLLIAGHCVLAPETPDGLMARMVALAGFEVAFIGMMGTTLNRIGRPDAGLLTATELVDNAARCIGASALATVVDAGAGFGNPINVRRTVAELQTAGSAGVLLRDAQTPLAHRTATDSVSIADMAVKIRAACDVRIDPAFVVLAGIEGVQGSSLEHIAGRAARYRDAGADLIHVGPLRSHAQAEALARQLKGIPLSCTLSPTSEVDANALAPLGFRIAFFPHCGLMASVPAIEHTFAELARTGSVGHLRPHIADFRQFTDIAGLPQVQQLEERYGVPDEQRTAL